MGIFRRKDSRFWQIWFEVGVPQRMTTDILIGRTTEEKQRSRELAQQLYHREMLARAAKTHGLTRERVVITFATFAQWYETHIVSHHRGAQREKEILATLTAHFGRRALHTIDRSDVIEWRTQRASKTSASTSNRELDVLKHLFAAAVPKYLDASPILKLKRLRIRQVEPYVLSREDEARLLAVLSKADQALIICALDTLMRLSDVVNLRRDQDRKTYLNVIDPKVRPYKVPVTERLRAALDALPMKGAYYFAHRRHAKQARDYRSSVRLMLQRACKACDPPIPYGRTNGGLTFHGLRHTATTRLVEAGVSLRIIQELGGWQSLRQLERYAHPSEQAKRDAVEAIGQRSTPVSR
jgi:integrase